VLRERRKPDFPILVVDDEAHSLKSFELTLRSHGLTNIIPCPDSLKVMDILERNEIELILLDILMPGLTGEALRLTGYSYKDVIGRYVWEIGMAATDGGDDQMKDLFPLTKGKTLPPILENTILTHSGEKRLISWSNSMMDGLAHVHIVSIGMDITEKIAAQEEADIRRRQLVEADKLVSLGILASEVAHEINNPNNLIAMNTPILRKAWEDIAIILDKYNDACGDFLVANVPYSEMSREIPEPIPVERAEPENKILSTR
jgi:PAS domain S-box-containing protein